MEGLSKKHEAGIYGISTIGIKENQTMCKKLKAFLRGNRTPFDWLARGELSGVECFVEQWGTEKESF